MPSMNDKVGAADQLDIGFVITAPTKDPAWLRKCAVIGLLTLIPIAGALNLSGWMRAITERRLKGGADVDVLPEAGLHYIGGGWRLFLAFLPLAGLMLVLMLGAGITAGVAASAGEGRGAAEAVAVGIGGVAYLGMLALGFVMSIVGPAIQFLHIVDGEPWASVAFRRQWEVIKEGGVQYLLLFVAVLVGGMIGQLGAVACFFGLFVTMPYAQAMTGTALAEFARLLPSTSGRFPRETHPRGGNVGSASGSPLGVSG